MNNGYISLHRSITSHWLWNEKPFDKRSAWIDLMLSANYKDRTVVLGNELIEVERGSFITSEVKLMDKWGWSKSKTRSFLKLLETDGMIIKKSDTKKTTISIVNYGLYQDSRTAEELEKDQEKTAKEPRKDCKKTAKGLQKDTDNNINKENKDNKGNKDNKDTAILTTETLWNLYPNKKGKAQAITKIPKLITKYGYEQMERTITRYCKEIRIKQTASEYIKHGSTFFNSGYVDYLDENYKEENISEYGRHDQPIKGSGKTETRGELPSDYYDFSSIEM